MIPRSGHNFLLDGPRIVYFLDSVPQWGQGDAWSATWKPGARSMTLPWSPKSSQEPPKTVQDGSKTSPGGSETLPRCPKFHPRCRQDHSKTSRTPPRALKMPPSCPQTPPNLPKTCQKLWKNQSQSRHMGHVFEKMILWGAFGPSWGTFWNNVGKNEFLKHPPV